jgi:hypothetical protein
MFWMLPLGLLADLLISLLGLLADFWIMFLRLLAFFWDFASRVVGGLSRRDLSPKRSLCQSFGLSLSAQFVIEHESKSSCAKHKAGSECFFRLWISMSNYISDLRLRVASSDFCYPECI